MSSVPIFERLNKRTALVTKRSATHNKPFKKNVITSLYKDKSLRGYVKLLLRLWKEPSHIR